MDATHRGECIEPPLTTRSLDGRPLRVESVVIPYDDLFSWLKDTHSNLVLSQASVPVDLLGEGRPSNARYRRAGLAISEVAQTVADQKSATNKFYTPVVYVGEIERQEAHG